MDVTVTVTDPIRSAQGLDPWVNTVTMKFDEGGKPTPERPPHPPTPPRGPDQLGYPNIIEVYKDKWTDSMYNFDKSSGLLVTSGKDGGFDFHVNMDNKYLQNYLLNQKKKKEAEDAVRFAYKWGMALIAFGLLQAGSTGAEDSSEADDDNTLKDRVSQLSRGVASVIVPTVMKLTKIMEEVS